MVKSFKFTIEIGDLMRRTETRFEDLRKDRELKQKDIAKVLNVLEDRYSKWERGIDDIPLVKSNELANFHKVSLDYLLGLSDVNSKTEKKEINLKLLCERLLELRKENGLTQKQLGNKVGFSQTTYSGYENGTSVPTTFKVYYIALFYGVSFDYLVGRTNKKKIK